jgi:mitochondrial import inner membrane translocase subunit TIM17
MRQQNDFTRDPCPYIIVNDIGVGFALGAVLGTLFNTYKGYRNSPRGERIPGIVSAVKTKAPILAGNFAVWSGMFNAFECVCSNYREKEDAWNSVISGAATGAILSARAGPAAMAVSGIFGGVILGVMEGVGVMMSKMSGHTYDPQPFDEPQKKQPSANPQTSEQSSQAQPHGLFKGRFGF